MKNKNDQTCPFALFPCNIVAEKPEQEQEPEYQPLQNQIGADKKNRQAPWTVFKDVYWI